MLRARETRLLAETVCGTEPPSGGKKRGFSKVPVPFRGLYISEWCFAVCDQFTQHIWSGEYLLCNKM